MEAFTDFHFAGSQRLVLEPTLMAALLAGGLGTVTHGNLPGTLPQSLLVSMSTGAGLPGQVTATSGIAALQPAPALAIPATYSAMMNSATDAAAAVHSRIAVSAPPVARAVSARHARDYVLRITLPTPKAAVLELDRPRAAPSVVAEDTAARIAAVPASPVAADRFAVSGVSGNLQAARLAELNGTSAKHADVVAGLVALPAEVRDFDLASIAPGIALPRAVQAPAVVAARPASVATVPATGLVRRPAVSSQGRDQTSARRDRVVGAHVFHHTAVALNGRSAGAVEVRIGGDTSLSIRVSELLSLVEGDMNGDLFAALSASSGAAEYVTFTQMRNAGIDVRYDPAGDRIVLTAE